MRFLPLLLIFALDAHAAESEPSARVIYPGSFAYSCLAPVSLSEVGCLFERDGNKKISFIRIPLDWPTAPQ